MHHGHTGYILFIDLTKKTYQKQPMDRFKRFLGGRGVNVRLLTELTSPSTGPLDPENPLIFGAGPWIGTLAPTACRLSVEFKSAVNGALGSGNAGGHFAAEMKFCGYDHIVITGRSADKCYLYIQDQIVHFRDADKLWSVDTWDTETRLKEMEDNPNLKSLCIGEAGINGVVFSTLVVDRARTVGYGGAGTVMGSKNLKAIAISGSQAVSVADPKGFLEARNSFMKDVFLKSQAVKNHRKGGTLLPYVAPLSARPHGVRNMSDDYWDDESIKSISREIFDQQYVVQRKGCFDCPVYCSSVYDVRNLRTEGFHANSFRSFGSNIDSRSAEGAFYANALANRLGMDSDHISSVVAWAIECFEQGLITTKDTGGLELHWNDIDTVLKLIGMIARREGFGDILALGVYEASKLIGRGSEQLAMVVKRNGIMEAAARTYKGWALGIMTSTKAGGHLRGAPGQEGQKLSMAQSRDFLGVDTHPSVTSYEHKAEMVVWEEQYKAVIDSVGICVLASSWTDVSVYNFEQISEFQQLITGEKWDSEMLCRVGEEIQTMERMYNLIHARFSRLDDQPPHKLFNNRVSDGPFKGEHLEEHKWNAMLDQYYTLHRWDVVSGIPTKKRLRELDLEYLMRQAEDAGIELPE